MVPGRDGNNDSTSASEVVVAVMVLIAIIVIMVVMEVETIFLSDFGLWDIQAIENLRKCEEKS